MDPEKKSDTVEVPSCGDYSGDYKEDINRLYNTYMCVLQQQDRSIEVRGMDGVLRTCKESSLYHRDRLRANPCQAFSNDETFILDGDK